MNKEQENLQAKKNKSLAWKLAGLALLFFCAFVYATWKRAGN